MEDKIPMIAIIDNQVERATSLMNTINSTGIARAAITNTPFELNRIYHTEPIICLLVTPDIYKEIPYLKSIYQLPIFTVGLISREVLAAMPFELIEDSFGNPLHIGELFEKINLVYVPPFPKQEEPTFHLEELAEKESRDEPFPFSEESVSFTEVNPLKGLESEKMKGELEKEKIQPEVSLPDIEDLIEREEVLRPHQRGRKQSALLQRIFKK